jgi:hypothetical protein
MVLADVGISSVELPVHVRRLWQTLLLEANVVTQKGKHVDHLRKMCCNLIVDVSACRGVSQFGGGTARELQT